MSTLSSGTILMSVSFDNECIPLHSFSLISLLYHTTHTANYVKYKYEYNVFLFILYIYERERWYGSKEWRNQGNTRERR